MFNKELAERAIKAIEANPKEWQQGTWRCETGMCFAGWVAHMAGATWASSNVEDSSVITPSGERMDVKRFAARELGLPRFGFPSLFEPWNSIGDLKAMVDSYE